MKKIGRILYREFVEGADVAYWLFLGLGLLTQVVTYIVAQSIPDIAQEMTALSLFSGICGVMSVLLCSRRKISYYVFGFIQVITYIIITYQSQLYGQSIINLVYFVTMVYGCVNWARSYEEGVVTPRKLPWWMNIVLPVVTVGLTFVAAYILRVTNDQQPMLDALTTVPAFVAQILMVTRFREQWWYWIFVDVVAVYMWAVAGNWCMAAQYLFWTANCIYGIVVWRVKGVES